MQHTVTLRQIIQLPDPEGVLRPIRAIATSRDIEHLDGGNIVIVSHTWWLTHDADEIERLGFAEPHSIEMPADMIAAILRTPDEYLAEAE